MQDVVDKMWGRLRVYENEYKPTNPEKNLLFDGGNAITYRAKAIMSRLLGGGLAGGFEWGSDSHPLSISGMAFGNGGHLIYDPTGPRTDVLANSGVGVILSGTNVAVTNKPAMPAIPAGGFGYGGVADQFTPGVFYEKVENGNVPWDGTTTIQDNAVGAPDDPNSTLYSETLRVPLDTVDGITFPTKTEVQFKCTVPLGSLNYTGIWGISQQDANLVSEAGLISGYVPTLSNILNDDPNTQLYSNDGREPAAGPNFDTGAGSWPRKDEGKTTSGASFDWGTLPINNTNPDQWAGGTDNTWNMVARKTFPALVKTPSFSLVFVWTVGF